MIDLSGSGGGDLGLHRRSLMSHARHREAGGRRSGALCHQAKPRRVNNQCRPLGAMGQASADSDRLASGVQHPWTVVFH